MAWCVYLEGGVFGLLTDMVEEPVLSARCWSGFWKTCFKGWYFNCKLGEYLWSCNWEMCTILGYQVLSAGWHDSARTQSEPNRACCLWMMVCDVQCDHAYGADCPGLYPIWHNIDISICLNAKWSLAWQWLSWCKDSHDRAEIDGGRLCRQTYPNRSTRTTDEGTVRCLGHFDRWLGRLHSRPLLGKESVHQAWTTWWVKFTWRYTHECWIPAHRLPGCLPAN